MTETNERLIRANEEKILDFLQNNLGLAKYGVTDKHAIKRTIFIESAIPNIKRLIDFIDPLNYYVSYVIGQIHVIPKN